MAAKKSSKKGEPANGNGALYHTMVSELETLAKDASYRKTIEEGAINEARGHDAWVLHTILKAVSDGDAAGKERFGATVDRLEELSGQVGDTEDNVISRVDKADEKLSGLLEKSLAQQVDLSDGLSTQVEESRDLSKENHAALVSLVEDRSSLISAEVESGFGEVGAAVDGTHTEVKTTGEAITERVGAAEETIVSQLDSAKAGVLERLDAVAERLSGESGEFRQVTEDLVAEFRQGVEEDFSQTRHLLTTEIDDLNGELTRSIDKGFNQMDQSFASVRSDLEVIKFLVMDLIRDRLGRTEVKGKQL